MTYNPPQIHKREIKRNEMKLYQKVKKFIWKKVGQHSKETPLKKQTRRTVVQSDRANQKYTNPEQFKRTSDQWKRDKGRNGGLQR